jgi:anti-anti-sigma factor
MEAVENDGLTAEVNVEPDRTVVVRVVGEIDISTVEAVRTAVATAMEHDPIGIVFDLSEVRFIDSSGIAVLLQSRKAIESIRIRNPSSVVGRLIELTGLTHVLPIEP